MFSISILLCYVFWIFLLARNYLLDYYTILPDGSKVSVENFKKLLLDNLTSISTDFSSGFHINEDHLNTESSDRKE